MPKKTAAISLVVLLAAIIAMADETELQIAPVTLGQQVTFRSAVLDEQRSLLVATPTGYDDSDQVYPVLYVLDGLSQFLHTVASADLLARNGKIPALMVVGVSTVDRNRDFTVVSRPDDSRGGGLAFLDYLEGEVIPLVERSYRTAPYRVLSGHSLGGLLAVNAMIERPGLFQAYIAASPAITSDERNLPKGGTALTERLGAALRTQTGLRRDLYMTMSGDEDPVWIEDLEALIEVLEDEAPAGLDWHLERLRDEDHGTTVVKSTFDGLKALFLGWDGREIAAQGRLEGVITHYRALSQRFGFEIDPPEQMVNLVGYRNLAAGRMDEAVKAFELNVKLRPDSANVYDSLGEALERKGILPGALKNYRIACRVAEETGHRALEVYQRNRDRVEQRLAERTGS